MDRRARLLELIDVTNQRGLELGPLHNPIIERSGTKVLYVDHADTETLRRKYEGHDVGEILEVDVVWGERRLVDALGEFAPVSYVVASHVIEHVPDLVGWLGQLAEALEPGGVVSLAVPDKRFCFDHRRAESRLGDVIEAHLERRRRPAPSQVFDFWSGIEEVDTAAAWAGELDTSTPLGNDGLAMGKVAEAHTSNGYVDVHCWVFTPVSFVDVIGRSMALGLLPDFAIASFHPTEPGSLEFHVSLVKLADDLPAEERTARQSAGLAAAAARLQHTTPHALVLLSERERRLLAAKRRLAGLVRHTVQRVRRPLR